MCFRAGVVVAMAVAAGAVLPATPYVQAVTFSRDVAPIVFAHCAGCHRSGEVGPFSLTTYREVRQHATQIAEVTARRIMPPWKPGGNPADFVGARVLTDAQIRTIRDWVAHGAPEGDPAELPALPKWSSGWQLGPPDLVVTMDAPYMLRAGGADVFRTFVLPVPALAAGFVKAVEFQPGNARAVHHANFGIDRTQSSRRLDALDPEPGYSGGMVPDAAYPPGHMLGWTPGQRPRPSPPGASWRLEPGSDVVVQLHMQPTGRPEPVNVSVGFFFTSDPPVRTPVGVRLGSQTIDIAAGDGSYVVEDAYELPVDVELLAIQPHAHNLARKMDAVAALPDGTSRSLIAIDDWDFRWQDVYRYARPIALPRGSTISMRYVYDNSAANPRNPHRPPQRVVWGQNTSDEMGDLWLQMIPANAADLQTLSGHVERKKRAEDLAGYTKGLQADPRNPLRHDAVAMLHLQSGAIDEAVVHLRESLQLNPDSAPTHYNLGVALSMQRKSVEALAEFRQAVRLDPAHADAHNNAGAMLHVAGRLDEAASHYRRALALRPDNADAHNNLGRVLTLTGPDEDAAKEFRAAIALRPDHASALAGLSWVLATTGDRELRDPAEAVRAGERAATLTRNGDPSVLDALASAYAAAGDFQRAVSNARRALEAATRLGMTVLADELQGRLGHYERRQPYLR